MSCRLLQQQEVVGVMLQIRRHGPPVRVQLSTDGKIQEALGVYWEVGVEPVEEGAGLRGHWRGKSGNVGIQGQHGVQLVWCRRDNMDVMMLGRYGYKVW